METITQLSQKNNLVISQPTKEEINSIIMFYVKIREDDENRVFPELNIDPDNVIDYYLDAKQSLISVIKIVVTPDNQKNKKITFFHCINMWDLSFPNAEEPYIAFVNEVLILNDNVLSKYQN